VGLDLVNPLLCVRLPGEANAEAVRICRIRYQDTPSALLTSLYGPLSGYPRAVGGATLRGWMNE
jgi:hypothetical protein